jgi:hypothetical protein
MLPEPDKELASGIPGERVRAQLENQSANRAENCTPLNYSQRSRDQTDLCKRLFLRSLVGN